MESTATVGTLVMFQCPMCNKILDAGEHDAHWCSNCGNHFVHGDLVKVERKLSQEELLRLVPGGMAN